MTIKNPHIIHWLRPDGKRYLCIQACDITPEKVADRKRDITCKRCKLMLNDRNDKLLHETFNDGRLNCDRKWIDEINERIEELEKQVGIPELKRLKRKVIYRWKNDED